MSKSNITYEEILVTMGFKDGITKPIAKSTSAIEKLGTRIENCAQSLDFWDGVLAESLSKKFEGWALGAVEAADKYEQSWKSLNYTFQDLGYTHDDVADSIGRVTKETTISGGVAREFYQTMGNYGVNNVELIENSLESLYGQCGQTGHAFKEVEGAVDKLVNTGRMMPKSLAGAGLELRYMAEMFHVSSDELKDAFKNMSSTERLEVLTAAMGDTSAGAEMMKNSLEGTKQELEKNWGGAKVALGQAILPSLKTMNILLGVFAEGMKDLMNFPGVNIVASGILGSTTALVGLTGALKMANYYWELYKDMQILTNEKNLGLLHTIFKTSRSVMEQGKAFAAANKEIILICLTILTLTYALDKLLDLGIFKGISETIHGGLSPLEDAYSYGSKSAIEGTNPTYLTRALPSPNNESMPMNTNNFYVQEGAFNIDARNKTSKEARQDIILGLSSLNDTDNINFNRRVQSDEPASGN